MLRPPAELEHVARRLGAYTAQYKASASASVYL